MGHFIFWVLHLMAVMFGFVFLFVTIPAHLIYSGTRREKIKIKTIHDWPPKR